MEIKEYNLDETIGKLQGPSREQIIVVNQWAATALDLFHDDQNIEMEFHVDGSVSKAKLNWASNFSKDAMRERKKIAEEGGVSLAWFVMAVVLDYKYLQQTEIGEGVDYRFLKDPPNNENFLQDSHFVEISGLLQESDSNTLEKRIKDKHAQIERGTRKDEPSSVIVTLFEKAITVKEVHK